MTVSFRTEADLEHLAAGRTNEKSEVEAVVTTKVDSIKNPLSGRIQAPEVGELIMDDREAKCEVQTGERKD